MKNETKGFHLNNLSYVGPIVMGFGGFIVVAACVMTFEARDSAAKVVPARFKSTGSSSCRSNAKTSNSNSSQSQRRSGNGTFSLLVIIMYSCCNYMSFYHRCTAKNEMGPPARCI